jgi:hypothetical protein
MAERTVIVCDACGRPASDTVTIRVGNRNLVKDLCADHVKELVAGARRPRPGRRKGSVAATSPSAAPRKRRGRPRKATGKKRAARKSTARSSAKKNAA